MAFNLVSAEQIKAVDLDDPNLPEDGGSGMTIKVDTAANLTKENPILLKGQLGAESDTTYMKLGDGKTAWNDLGYIVSNTATTATKALQDDNGNVIADTYETKADFEAFLDNCSEELIESYWETPQKFVFNKNDNMGPINFRV